MDATPHLHPHPHHQAIIFEKSTHTKNNTHADHHHHKQVITTTTTTTSISPASPPSSSSSPSHEFSFTISLHSSSSSSNSNHPTTSSSNNTKPSSNNSSSVLKNSSSSSSSLVAIDLSPADDIFFHGHLLPLHLLSHLPTQSSASANSLDSFTHSDPKPPSPRPPKPKPKPFSLFNKWKTAGQTNHDEDKDEEQQHKKKRARRRLDMMSQAVKRCMRMARHLLLRGIGDSSSSSSTRPPHYSFSGVMGSTHTHISGLKHRPGHYSAPPSIRTSPSNSGLLVATDSTMDDLHAAIQAAIAHCKNSFAADDKPPPPSSLLH